jgi:hypothetical protein
MLDGVVVSAQEFKRLSKEIEERSDGAVRPPFNVIDLYDACECKPTRFA